MTIATPASDGPIGFDASDQQQAGFSSNIHHHSRLNALRRLALLDTPAEQAFDRLTRLAAKILHAPVSLLSLVDGDRSFFKSSVGLPELWASRREIPLSHSVCQHVVAMNAPLVINDARANTLVSDNQAVAELRIVAYLGIPLVTSEGHALGTFAVIDIVPREWTEVDVTILGDLGASALTEIELRAETDQRLRVEQRLHLMEAVVGNAAAAVLITEAGPAESVDPRIVFVNDAYTRLTGYSSDEVVGSTHQELNGSEADRTQIDSIRTALAAWKPARLEFLSHRKDGSAFWTESNIVPIADKTQRYSHWVIIQRDISVQKEAEEALRESEERFRVLTEAIPQIVWTARPDGWLDYYNRRWFDYTGLTLEQTQGWGWELVVHPDDLKACLDLWAQAVQTGKPYEIKYRFKRAADGAYRWHLGQALPVRDEAGQIVKWFGTCTDIDELEQGEQRLAAQHTCTRIIADSVVMDETIPKLLQALCEDLGWALGQMWQLDPRASLLRCVAAWHDPVAAVASFADLSRKTTFCPGLGLPGRVWTSSCPEWVSDVGKDTNFPRAEEAERCGLHGAFAFPILHGEKVLGVMEFCHDNIPEPDGPLLEMIAAIGSQVGQFMERMRTEESLRHGEERFRQTAEMLKEANQELEVRVAQRTSELSEANEFLKALLENIQDGIVACNAEGVMTVINRTTREFGGGPDDKVMQLEAQPINPNQWADQYSLYRPDGQTLMPTDELPLIRALRGERILNVEMVIAPKEGAAHSVLASGRAFYDAQGKKLGAVVSLNDITEHKRADEAHALLAAIVESSDEAIISKKLDGTIVSWNLGAQRLYGYTAEEVVGKPVGILFPLDRADELKRIVEQLARGERITQYETVRLRKDGSRVDVAVTISAVKNKNGQIIVASNIARDITERKRAEAELLKVHEELERRVERRTAELASAKEAAEAANRAKSEFFSRMSHELRTPLNVILGFGQLLELDVLTDPQRESAEQIGKGGRHLLTLVNEVLDIARIEAGGTGVVSLEEVDVGEVIREVLGLVQPLADQAGVRLMPPQPEFFHWAVHADLQRLKQVLLNLLSNAIKYNRQRGNVAVCCTEVANTKLRISVTDTGPGILPEKMHRLFAAFDRLEAEKNGVEGTGLGLTLSKGLVEAMHGKMGVESTFGKGSTFWVELPSRDKTAGPAGDHPETVANPEETSFSSGTVLCVEDNPANFRLIERILELRPGVRLLSATQGPLGIDLARQHRPDLIFLDLHLPGIQGDEVLRQLQDDAATRDIPVIMLSADATPHQAERLRAAGARRFMVKPLNVKEFLQILDETLKEAVL